MGQQASQQIGRAMYIADFNNVRVRKISKNGVITTVAGGGTTGLGDGGNAKMRNCILR